MALVGEQNLGQENLCCCMWVIWLRLHGCSVVLVGQFACYFLMSKSGVSVNGLCQCSCVGFAQLHANGAEILGAMVFSL